jgi:propane monooxygenase large subunit
VPQPHLRFDDKDMWKLEHVRGHTLGSPLKALRAMSDAERDAHVAEYRKGFTINPCH